MKRKKILIITVSSLLVFFIAFGIFRVVQVKTQVKELFWLNKQLQKEGYYMADFEFRGLGFSYLLDKGEYLKSINNLGNYILVGTR